ncbi:hypothetical protein LCGC14_2401180 [marine sediment metagenome]|uniref:NTP pyrophosphohydrolase MazG-like domain-containing protein n=1 Tax=marine sediment metagenome TaxID=412755 RepID=A0A0F9EPQ8_9ZZZZ
MMERVLAFARAMTQQLDANSYKSGWVNLSPKWFLNRLRQETGELERAIKKGDINEIKKEAADVGNFAMMIVDVTGGFKEPR